MKIHTLHMTQLAHRIYNPGGDERSENCGPTSLAMGLRYLGLRPPKLPEHDGGRARPQWLPEGGSPQEWIDAVRFAMFSDPWGRSLNREKDGLEWTSEGPRRVWQKHQALVNWDDLRRGAENCGALASPLRSLHEVRRALCKKVPVLLAGDPSAPGAYGPHLGVNYRGGHLILAVDYDGRYRVHDPLCLAGPVWLSSEEVRAFCGAQVLGDQPGLSLHCVRQIMSA